MKKHHFICTIAVLLAMVANVQAQEERNKSLINSYLHGWESVSYTHLTLPTIA